MHMQSVQTSIGTCTYQWANDIANGMLRSLYSGAKIVSQSESRSCITRTEKFFIVWEYHSRYATHDTYINWTLISAWSASMLPLHRSRFRQATQVWNGRWLLSRRQSQAIDEMSNSFHLMMRAGECMNKRSRCFQKQQISLHDQFDDVDSMCGNLDSFSWLICVDIAHITNHMIKCGRRIGCAIYWLQQNDLCNVSY